MIYVILYYIISTLIYFGIGGGSTYWSTFNMLSILVPFTYIMYNLCHRYRLKNREFAWLEFALILTIVRVIYTSVCAFAPYEWIYECNKIYFTIFTAWLIIKMVKRRGI